MTRNPDLDCPIGEEDWHRFRDAVGVCWVRYVYRRLNGKLFKTVALDLGTCRYSRDVELEKCGEKPLALVGVTKPVPERVPASECCEDLCRAVPGYASVDPRCRTGAPT